MNEFDRIVSALTPDIYRRFRRAIELKKWPDGSPLNPEQMELCLQAVIAYESKHVPETERTGFIPPKNTQCNVDDGGAETIRWQNREDN